MKRIQSIALIVLPVSLTLLVLGWSASFPVSISKPGQNNLASIHPVFWVGLFLAYPAVFLLGLHPRRWVRMMMGVFFVFLFSAPKLLYLQTGSDTQVFISLLEVFNGQTQVQYHENAYSEWPLLTIWGRLIQLFCHCDSAVVYLTFWSVQIIGLALAAFLLFRNPEADNPSDFLGLCLWSIFLFWVWDWQVSAYNWALILTFAILALLAYRRWRIYLLIGVLFTTLTLSHGFLPVFVWLILPIELFIEWLSLRLPPKIARYWPIRPEVEEGIRPPFLAWLKGQGDRLALIGLLATIQSLVWVFHSSRLPTRIILTFQNYYDRRNELAVNETLQGVVAATSQALDNFDVLTKLLAWFDLWIAVLLLGIAFFVLFISRRAVIRDWAVFIAGIAHFFIGSFLPILGARAVNAILILPVRGLRVLMKNEHSRVPILFLFFTLLALFPVNQLRQQKFHVQYNTPQSLHASRFLVPLIERDVAQDKYDIGILLDKSQMGYLRNSVQKMHLRELNYQQHELDNQDFNYILVSDELQIALSIRNWPELQSILEHNHQAGVCYNRIYDSGDFVWLSQTADLDQDASSFMFTGCFNPIMQIGAKK